MPLYELECLTCGNVDEYIVGLSEMSGMADTNNMNFEELGIICKKCGKNYFKKLLSPNAKMSENWSAWNKKTK